MSSYVQINTPIPTAKPDTDLRMSTADLPPPAESNGFPIQLHIHSVRIWSATTVLIAALTYTTYFLIDGYKLTTTDATKLSDSEKEDLLDKYNSYSDGIASVVAVPFQQLVSLLVPVFFLCYSTKAFLKPDQGIVAQAGPLVFDFVLTWALGQGLNSLNVQWEAPSVEFFITNSDLLSAGANSGFDCAMSHVSNSAQSAGIPSTDTILRSTIQPTTTSSETNCLTEEGVMYYIHNPSVDFMAGALDARISCKRPILFIWNEDRV